jgi:hypothetical protein
MGARARLWRRVLIAVSIAAAGAKALALGTAWVEPIASDRTGGQPPSRSLPAQPQLGQALLTTIQIWLSTQFGLPVAQSQPRIELIPAAKIAAMRYRGLNPDSATHAAPGADVRGPEANVVAVYSDSTRTIYLADEWTGGTAAELSVLVHEMVHHLQNVGGLKYECPQAREQLAYKAQDRWLNLFGRSLDQDFELDGFSLLIKPRCMLARHVPTRLRPASYAGRLGLISLALLPQEWRGKQAGSTPALALPPAPRIGHTRAMPYRPRPPSRRDGRRQPRPDRRRALELLAGSPEGCTEGHASIQMTADRYGHRRGRTGIRS